MRRRAETAPDGGGDVLPAELVRVPSLERARLTAEGRLDAYMAEWEARRQAWAAERGLDAEQFAEAERRGRQAATREWDLQVSHDRH